MFAEVPDTLASIVARKTGRLGGRSGTKELSPESLVGVVRRELRRFERFYS